MKVLLILSISIIGISHNGFAQKDNHSDLLNVNRQLRHVLSSMDTYHYSGQMRFKEMGGDTFEIRNFAVSYQSNPFNPLYGYDFEIAEQLTSGDIYSLIVKQDAFYVLYSGSRGMSQRPLHKTIDMGSLLEYLRNSFMLDQVFAPFLDNPIMIKESKDSIYLSRDIDESFSRLLVLDKNTYLPVRSVHTYKDQDLGLTQITEMIFDLDRTSTKLPEHALNPDYYINAGYTLKVQYEENDASPSENKRTFSPEQYDLLIHHPFISSTDDTITIESNESAYILLDFWYASCLPCLKAIPEVNKLAETYAGKGLQVFGINCTDTGNRQNLVSKFREKNINFPFLFGPRTLLNSLQISSFPTYALIIPGGKIEIIEGGIDEVKSVLKGIFDE